MRNIKRTSIRKQDHIDICLNEEVGFKVKTNGFEKYDFIHYAVSELQTDDVELKTDFFEKEISLPFLISSMTGGTKKAEKINSQLALAASELNIPIGVGSQRQLLENNKHLNSYKIIRKNAPNQPILGNIGASQVVKFKDETSILRLAEVLQADAMIIHLNLLQELIQDEGEPIFKGFISKLEQITNKLEIPIIVKEIGNGINKETAKLLLNCGVQGIDVAGAGGTSWSAVEYNRNKYNINKLFREWGLPTSYCIRTIYELKNKFNFLLIGSGGVNNSLDIAKALALGADITASARVILQKVVNEKIEGVVGLIKNWFDDLKKIMILTGSKNISELQAGKLRKKEELY